MRLESNSKAKPFNAKITAVGKYVPEKILSNSDLEKMVDTSSEWIMSRTGIAVRHIVEDGEATSHMATRAVRELMDERNLDPEEIDLIIVGTVTPDMFFPSTACLIQDALRAENAWGFDLSAACSGFIYALSAGAQFVESGAHKKVIVVGADTMSSIMDYEDRNTCVLFGDGAGAILLEPTDDPEYGILDFSHTIDGSGGRHLYMTAGGSARPTTLETVQNRMHYLRQDGKAVFKYAVNSMAKVANELLDRNGLTGRDIALLIPHQANLRIIHATARKLGLEESQVLINIERYANTTAATIPLALYDAVKDDRLHKGDLALCVTFGAGFTEGGVLMRWSY